MIAETICGEETVDVTLVCRSGCEALLHTLLANQLRLNREAFLCASLRRSCSLSRERQLNAALLQKLVGGVEEIVDLGHAYVGHGLVDDLFDLDRRDAGNKCGTGHDAIFAQCLRGDHGCKLHHQPSTNVQAALTEHFIESEIVKEFDQFRVCHRESGDVTRKEIVVNLLCASIGSHSDFLS